MDTAQTTAALGAAFGRLGKGLDLSWRYPARMPRRPLAAKPAASWRTWDPANPAPLTQGARNWFYATAVFPEILHGVPLAGQQAFLFMNGYCPFTLWLDGEEKYREEHVWYATGPLADPIVWAIEPGRAYHLILCLEPTATPFRFSPLNLTLNPLPVVEMQWEAMTACGELGMAEALARTDAERTVVRSAAARLDLTALEQECWPQFLASVAAMENALEPFASRAKQHIVHLIGHTHIDMDWQWTWQDTLHCIRRDFHSVLGLMADEPDVRFSLSQIPSYAAVQSHDPENFAAVQGHVASGRWENLAATWVEGDLNMADGESLARHLQYAGDWSRRHLGQAATVFWAPDTFGHPGNMPQIARLGECDTYFHWRCNPGGEQNWPARWWEGIDGTAILTFSSAYGGGLMPGPWEYFCLHNLLDAMRQGLTTSHSVWGLGDHGGGLPRHQLALFRKIRHRPLLPTFRFSTVRELRDAVLPDQARLPRNHGETHTLFEGCYTTHAWMKVHNRRSESALLTAEVLAALAGLDRTVALREAWTPVLFSQFHDIFCGCAIPGSYEDAGERAENALRVAATVTREAAGTLVPAAPQGDTLALLNPLGFARIDIVETELPEDVTALADAAGRQVPLQPLGCGCALFVATDVPAFGRRDYRLLRDLALPPPAAEITDQGYYLLIDTPWARCRIAKNSGIIGSCFDKRLNRELVAYGVPKRLQHVQASRAELGLNVFEILDEAANPMTAWLMNDVLRQENLVRGAEVSIIENGPVCVRVKVVHRFRASRIDEEIRIFRDVPRIEFIVAVNWAEPGGPEVGVPHLKLGFAANLTAARVRAEGPYTVREVPANGLEQVTQKWVDVTGDEFGFTVLNDSRYGYDATGGGLRVSLIRNSYNPDPDSDRGQHLFRLAFVPHGPTVNPAELWRQGMSYNRACVPLLTAAAADCGLRNHEPWLRLDGSDAVVCTALRAAEHEPTAVLLRLFETCGESADIALALPVEFSTAQEVNFQEHPTGPAQELVAAMLRLSFRPYEIKTLCLRRQHASEGRGDGGSVILGS